MVTAEAWSADARPRPLDGEVDIDRDRLLVERAQAGDNSAFDSLYSFYSARLERYCLQRLRDPHEAQDVAQETFLRAWRALPNFGGDRRFYPWLSVIASNLCTDALRRRQRFGPIPVAEPEERDMGFTRSTEDSVVASADVDLATEALSHLSARHRRVLELRERSGLTYQQIAEKEGLRITTVETLIWRARQAFKREFLELSGAEGAMVGILGTGVLARALRRLVRMPKAIGAKVVALGPSGIAAGVGGAVATGAIVVASVAGGHAATHAALESGQSNSQIGTSLHMGSSDSASAVASTSHNASARTTTSKTQAGSSPTAATGPGAGPTATVSVPGVGTTIVPGSGSVPAGGVTKVVGPTATTIEGAVSGAAGAVSGTVSGVVNAAGQTVNGATGTVDTVLSGLGNTLGKTLNDAGDTVTQVVDGVGKAVSTALNGVGKTVGGAVGDATGAADQAIGGVKQVVKSATQAVNGAVPAVSDAEAAVAGAKDAAGQAAQNISQTASHAVSGLKNILGGTAPATPPSVPSVPSVPTPDATTTTTGLINHLLG
ncbi:MAG: sigma-70 family RNA polymerase sigma factor [Acidimicrobiales bacterium]|jgi:RNA polymerase sigma-70 factor, ECF subfamily